MTNNASTHEHQPHGAPATSAPPTPETATEAADRLGKMLAEIDAGNVSASAVERAFLAGAAYGLKLATGH